MTDEMRAEAEEMAKVMTEEVKAAMRRVMAATQPESYEGLVANVVAMRFLGECAYETLDTGGRTLADTLMMVQRVVLGPKLAKLMAEAGEES